MKKLLSVIISVIMLMTTLQIPTMAAVSNSYQTPTILPPANTHPRVLLRSSDIATIKANETASQNTAAKSHVDSLISNGVPSIGTSYSSNVENAIEAFAYDYVINGNEENGKIAVAKMVEYLNNVKFSSSEDLTYRYAGATVFHAAEVYDWCYPLISASDSNTIISKCETILKNYMECGYPPTKQSSITGHGSEAQILRDMLSFGIAVYDERPDIYNAVMGRIQQEMVPARNDYYRSHYIHQGTEYGWYRFYWDLYAQALVDRMTEGEVSLFNKEDMKEVAYGMIYARRPDGKFFNEGDNKQTHYWYYNNFNQQTAKLAGDIFDDPFFKGEYRMMRGEENFDNNNFKDERSFNAVNWLIMNNPDVGFTPGGSGGRNPLPKARYFGSPVGKIYAKTEWMYTKSGANSANAVAVEMKIGERYSANHDHLDAGTFQIYYRGLLTGEYGAQDDYNSDFDLNYYKRTVAHNGLTIYESSESFKGDDFITTLKNDGGQLLATSEPGSFSAWVNNSPYKRATVVNHSIGDDYSYIKGDITAAYSTSKAGEVARSMVFLPTGTNDAPGVMVVYDKVTSKKDSQTKKFLLHTSVEPTIEGSKTTVVNQNTLEYSNGSVSYDGKLTVNTLLPASATISKVAGCVSGGTTYTAPKSDSKYEPEWGRIEIQAATEGTTTQFLNVLTVSKTSVDPADSIIIGNENSSIVGTQTPFNQVALFANTGKGSLEDQGSFAIASGSDLDFYIFGVGEGRWTIKKDNAVLAVGETDATNGTITFSVDGDAAGNYTIAPFASSDLEKATVLWYDYRVSDGASQSQTTDSWYDITERGNDFDIPSNAKWTNDGLLVNADGKKVTLPSVAKNAANGNQFTIELAVADVDQTDDTKSLSILGDVKSNFAIHKIVGADKVYLKLPGWNSTLFRPFYKASEFADEHHIITVDKDKNIVKWYVNGYLAMQKKYTHDGSVGDINLISGNGSVVYQQIKIFSVALTASEALDEYNAYVEGF